MTLEKVQTGVEAEQSANSQHYTKVIGNPVYVYVYVCMSINDGILSSSVRSETLNPV